jgi:cell division protein FtsI (penicillin-binding protein 3)
MKIHPQTTTNKPLAPWRRVSVLIGFVLAITALLARAVDLQMVDASFFEKQGDARHLRLVTIPAHRGDILDRNGEPLAISTPVSSVWMNPQLLETSDDGLPKLAKLLDIKLSSLKRKIRGNQEKEFVYLKRHIAPELAAQVDALNISGIALQSEYRRYYPTGEVTAHVLGFDNIDDNGQEGIELAYNNWLKGEPGKKRVIRDRLGRTFNDIERIRDAVPGKVVKLSIDKDLQYLTYRTLKAAVLKNNAVAGSAVVLDVKTGRVLAMANQPSFNVNDRDQLIPSATRNRAVTDVFEPGSTMKPLSMAAALESGVWKPSDTVQTSPGYMRILGNPIRDDGNYGKLDLGGVIERSSNVGISKIILAISAEQQADMYQKFGLGATTGSGFPGEVNGRLSLDATSNDFERATMAFGYGVSVTPLQLARAYQAIANDGVIKPVSFLADSESTGSMRIMSVKTARELRKMMERVVSAKGTGKRAHVPNYSVAGKTGTVHKFVAGGYAEDRYISIFAGMVPADHPDVVMVVMINEPRNGEYFGGLVAAPVFSTVMSGAMRLLDIPPDRISDTQLVEKTQVDSSHHHVGRT